MPYTTSTTDYNPERLDEQLEGGTRTPEGAPRTPLTVQDMYKLEVPDDISSITDSPKGSESPASEEDPAAVPTSASVDRLGSVEILGFAKKIDLGKTALSARNNGFNDQEAAASLDRGTRPVMGTNKSEVATNTGAMGNLRDAKEGHIDSVKFEERIARSIENVKKELAEIGLSLDKSEIESSLRSHIAGETIQENLKGTNMAAGDEVLLSEDGAKDAEDAAVVELTAKAIEAGKDVLLSTESIGQIEQVWKGGHENNRLKSVIGEVHKSPHAYIFMSHETVMDQEHQETIVHKDGALALIRLRNGMAPKEVLKGMRNVSPENKQRYWAVIDTVTQQYGSLTKGLNDPHTLLRMARLMEHVYSEHSDRPLVKPGAKDYVLKINH